MTETDLNRIESELQITLPAFYRDYALRWAKEDERLVNEIFERFEDPLSSLFTCADELISHNRDCRRGDFCTELWVHEEDQRPFDAEGILLIGTNGGGNYCFIRLNSQDEGVWWWDHESSGVKQYYASLEAFHQRIVQVLAENEAWEQSQNQ